MCYSVYASVVVFLSMKNIRWVIQQNLIAENDLEAIRQVCNDMAIAFEEIQVIPFSSEVPEFTKDEKVNIYYGSTTLMYNIYRQLDRPRGLFFDEQAFTSANYLAAWKEYMLNYGAKVTTFREFSEEEHPPESLWFMRPDADDKSFNGDVRTFSDIQNFIANAVKYDNVILTGDTKILVGPPYRIDKEWRNYVVNGKVVTSSLYRKDFRLNKSRHDAPESMIQFVEARCREYTPHSIFAMDIALCGDQYYIIECGCLNSVGFYDADVAALVKAVSECVATHS